MKELNKQIEALSKFEDMILAYSKSNELSSKINEILGKVREDKYKLEAFRINLKIYIWMVRSTDVVLTNIQNWCPKSLL